MSRSNSKGDVAWFIDNRKKPIAYSTVAVSEYISALANQGGSVNDLIGRVTWNFDAKNILQLYVKYGYGDTPAANLFGEPLYYRTTDGRFTDGRHIFKGSMHNE